MRSYKKRPYNKKSRLSGPNHASGRRNRIGKWQKEILEFLQDLYNFYNPSSSHGFDKQELALLSAAIENLKASKFSPVMAYLNHVEQLAKSGQLKLMLGDEKGPQIDIEKLSRVFSFWREHVYNDTVT